MSETLEGLTLPQAIVEDEETKKLKEERMKSREKRLGKPAFELEQKNLKRFNQNLESSADGANLQENENRMVEDVKTRKKLEKELSGQEVDSKAEQKLAEQRLEDSKLAEVKQQTQNAPKDKQT